MDGIGIFFRFLYRIRRWIVLGPVFVGILAYFFSSNLPKKYEASTTIYTGIMSSANFSNDKSLDWNTTNNAFDNIINLVRSRSTLERVAIRLFAQAMIKGDPAKDNIYIKAESYNNLIRIVPKDVRQLIDKSDESKTVQNLFEYKKEDKNNFLYGLLNYKNTKYFSFNALNAINVSRLNTSDIIEIKYSCEDPGLATQTLSLLNEELIAEYTQLQLGPSNSVIDYFEKQLQSIREQLKNQEDSLMYFSINGKIINYEEQTKQLTTVSANLDDRYQQALMDFYSSRKLITKLESQLETRTDLMRENKEFVHTMNQVSLLTKKITEQEMADQGAESADLDKLSSYKELLDEAEAKLYDITIRTNNLKYTKEGMATTNILQEWLTNVLQNEKSKAEISALKDRKKEIDDEFRRLTPIGPSLKKQEREIGVSEESYHTILTHLAQAKLQQKNIEMISATLRVVSPPLFPLEATGTRRRFIVMAAFLGSLVFILSIFVILELLDKTVRDKNRAKSLTKGKILGAFPGNNSLSNRGFAKEISRIAASYTCNMLQSRILPNGPTFFNLISVENGEGKSYIAEVIRDYWEEKGLSVQILSYEEDFDTESRQFLLSENINDLYAGSSKYQPDIILVEYPSFRQSNIPKAFLQQAQANIMIVKANRAWKGSDQMYLDDLTTQAGQTPVYILINNAQKFAVEDFTGQLPPYTRFSKRVYDLLNLGLTAERNKNLE